MQNSCIDVCAVLKEWDGGKIIGIAKFAKL